MKTYLATLMGNPLSGADADNSRTAPSPSVHDRYNGMISEEEYLVLLADRDTHSKGPGTIVRHPVIRTRDADAGPARRRHPPV